MHAKFALLHALPREWIGSIETHLYASRILSREPRRIFVNPQPRENVAQQNHKSDPYILLPYADGIRRLYIYICIAYDYF